MSGSPLKPDPALEAFVRSREARQLDLLAELVRIESWSGDKPGVDRLGARLARELEAAGMQVQRFPQDTFGDQLVARRSFGGSGRVLIVGHMDTVWPTGTLRDWPYSVGEDGLARGPGVGDMKGGLVVALGALEALQALGRCRLDSITFLLVPDEELGTPWSRPLIEKEARAADWAFVMEPGRESGGVVTSRSVVGKFVIRARGKSAHCGVDWARGASAVRALAAKVAPLEALTRNDEGIIVNVGVFTGGEARQVIPASAEMQVDFRAPDQAQADLLMRRIEAIAAGADDPRVTITAEGIQTRPAYPRSEATVRLYQAAAAVAAGIGIPLPEEHTRGGSDGSLVAAQGVATLDGMGPVSLDDCSRQERVVLSTIVPRTLLLAGTILALDEQRNGR
jgi:glutamate carboxypeptidase